MAFVQVLPVSAGESDAVDSTNYWMKNDRFKLNLSAFRVNYDTELQLTAKELGFSTKIGMEDDLGLSDADTIPYLDGYIRLSPRHSLGFSYYDLSRDGDLEISRTLIIDDTIFTEGSRLETTFDYRVLTLDYAFSYYQNERQDHSLILGAYIFDLSFEVESLIEREDEDSNSAFPYVGLRSYWRPSPQTMILASVDYLTFEKGSVEGDFLDLLFGVEYRLANSSALGLVYQVVSVEGEHSEDDDKLNYTYEGPRFYFSLPLN